MREGSKEEGGAREGSSDFTVISTPFYLHFFFLSMSTPVLRIDGRKWKDEGVNGREESMKERRVNGRREESMEGRSR